jgi:hypothetical protein
MIYFVQCEATKLVKIGVTNDVRRRMAMLATGSAAPLKLLGIAEGDAEAESDLHQRFAAQRVRGEWFQIDAEIDAEIAKLTPFVVPEKPRHKVTEFMAATGLSKSYSSEILSGARVPNIELAARIFEQTGQKFGLAELLADDVLLAISDASRRAAQSAAA